MKRFILQVAAAFFCLSLPAPAVASTACSVAELSFSLDEENGAFVGMSQPGALLVLRNTGASPCAVPARPTLVFEDARHQSLRITRRTPPGLHPGPVLVPITVAPQAEAAGLMHWVSADAYDAHNCFSPAFVALVAGTDRLRIPFGRQMCGPKGLAPFYDLALIKPDAVSSAPAAGFTLPAGVVAIATGYGDQCRRMGGTLRAGDRPRIMSADLDGDGNQDYVLNPQNLDCSAAATAFCGNGGCNIEVALSRDGYRKPVTILGGQPTIAQREDGTELEVWVGGFNCNLSDRSKDCWSITAWKAGRSSTRYRARAIEMP